MARFLRFIFNLLLICYIAAALALFIPPLVGVTTSVTLEDTSGNQETGSVNYAWRTPLKSVVPGDEILVTADGAVNVYSVQAIDTENSVVTVSGDEALQIPVRTYVYKMLVTVPYLGYIAILLQTTEGMLILGAVAGVLLILCILTAIWCRKRKIKKMKEDEEELEDEKDNRFFEDLAAQKREADARADAEFTARRREVLAESALITEPALDEEYEEFPAALDVAAAEPVKEDQAEEAFDEAEATGDAEQDLIRAELPEEEIFEAASEEENAEAEKADEQAEAETEAEKPLEIAADEIAVERAVETGNIPGVQAALEAALNTQQIQRHVRRAEVMREPDLSEEPLAAEEIELAMPVYTVDEFLQKAYEKGQDPVVRKDELTGVTYIDFSECI